jgi:hypothetical protein
VSTNLFLDELRELYDGELLGEAFFERLLQNFDNTEWQYKLTTALQLETETKARLRPYLFHAGIQLNENGQARSAGLELAMSFDGLSWVATMKKLVDILEPAVNRYKHILASAPPNYRELASDMLVHEESLLAFVELELKGKGDSSVTAITAQLEHKIYPQ